MRITRPINADILPRGLLVLKNPSTSKPRGKIPVMGDVMR